MSRPQMVMDSEHNDGLGPGQAPVPGDGAFVEESALDEQLFGPWDPSKDDAIGDGEVSEDESKASTVASTVSLDVPVSVPPGSKWPSCFLCTTVANSPSPLAGAKPDDKYSGMIPWNSHSKFTTEDVTVDKTPKGKVCLPCRTNFKAIGHEATYGSARSFAFLQADTC